MIIQLLLLVAVHAPGEVTVTAPVPPLAPNDFPPGEIELTVPVAANKGVMLSAKRIHTTNE